MIQRMDKYIGRSVEIIYVDRTERITQRVIEVRSVEGAQVRAYCFRQSAPRLFKLERILAVRAVGRRTG